MFVSFILIGWNCEAKQKSIDIFSQRQNQLRRCCECLIFINALSFTLDGVHTDFFVILLESGQIFTSL